jgi:uncharacterized protein (TIGR00645 family)
MPPRNWVEKYLESGLFTSRWLLAPFYVGLVIALAMLLIVFVRELVISIPEMMRLDAEQMILSVLTLIDLSLAGNLVLIVIFSGYENFVSKITAAVGSQDRPSWMGTLDFSGLKMKLIGSMVAISAISLLRAFVSLTEPYTPLNERKLFWLVMLHLTFLASGVMFALMDWLASVTEERRIMEQRELEQYGSEHAAANVSIGIPP